MKLTHWEVENYKSLDQGEFSASDSTILIGKNNSGKSSVIDSIIDFRNLYLSRREEVESDWFRSAVAGKEADNTIRISMKFTLSDSEYARVMEKIDNTPRTSSKNFADNEWLSKLQIDMSIEHDSRPKTEYIVNYHGEYISLQEVGRNSPSGFTGTSLQGTYNDIIVESIENWKFVGPFRRPENVMEVPYNLSLERDGRNLVQVLHSIDNTDRELFNKISEKYVELMDGVTNLTVEYHLEGDSDNEFTIIVEEGSFKRKFNSEEISSGSKEILVLLTQVFLASENTDLLLIEEPELHLHPEAERRVFDTIQQISEDNGPQLLISTHSDVFVNQSEVGDIVRIEREENSTIRNVPEAEIGKELSDLGYDKSGLIQSEAVVFVEGRSDKIILKEFAQTLGLNLGDRGIEIVELEGEGNMREHGRSLVKLLDSFEIPYLFIVDSHGDEPGEVVHDYVTKINREDADTWWYTKPEYFHAWSKYSIESYLLDAPGAISSATDGNQEAIENIIHENEDEPDKAEVLESIYSEVISTLEPDEKPYKKDTDGRTIARKMDREQIPDEVKEVIDMIASLVD